MTCELCHTTMHSLQPVQLEEGSDMLHITQWQCTPCATMIEEIDVIPTSSCSTPRKLIYPVRPISRLHAGHHTVAAA